jgi:hypothetical protein
VALKGVVSLKTLPRPRVSARADEAKKPKRKPLNQNKMKENPIDERLEIVQDVIDRLLYLDADKLEKYKESLSVLHEVFNVGVEIVDGVRKYS